MQQQLRHARDETVLTLPVRAIYCFLARKVAVVEGTASMPKISVPPLTITMSCVSPEATPAVYVIEPVQSELTLYVPEVVRPVKTPPSTAVLFVRGMQPETSKRP